MHGEHLAPCLAQTSCSEQDSSLLITSSHWPGSHQVPCRQPSPHSPLTLCVGGGVIITFSIQRERQYREGGCTRLPSLHPPRSVGHLAMPALELVLLVSPGFLPLSLYPCPSPSPAKVPRPLHPLDSTTSKQEGGFVVYFTFLVFREKLLQ
jgi:hypothetical protein